MPNRKKPEDQSKPGKRAAAAVRQATEMPTYGGRKRPMIDRRQSSIAPKGKDAKGVRKI